MHIVTDHIDKIYAGDLARTEPAPDGRRAVFAMVNQRRIDLGDLVPMWRGLSRRWVAHVVTGDAIPEPARRTRRGAKRQLVRTLVGLARHYVAAEAGQHGTVIAWKCERDGCSLSVKLVDGVWRHADGHQNCENRRTQAYPDWSRPSSIIANAGRR